MIKIRKIKTSRDLLHFPILREKKYIKKGFAESIAPIRAIHFDCMKKVLYVLLFLSVIFIFCILPFIKTRVYHAEGRVSAIEYRDDGTILLELKHLTKLDAASNFFIVPKNAKIRFEKNRDIIELQDVVYFNTISKKNYDGYGVIKEMLVMSGNARPYIE